MDVLKTGAPGCCILPFLAAGASMFGGGGGGAPLPATATSGDIGAATVGNVGGGITRDGIPAWVFPVGFAFIAVLGLIYFLKR